MEEETLWSLLLSPCPCHNDPPCCCFLSLPLSLPLSSSPISSFIPSPLFPSPPLPSPPLLPPPPSLQSSSEQTQVDLSDLGVVALYSEVHPTSSHIVHYGVNMIAPVYKLQVPAC